MAFQPDPARRRRRRSGRGARVRRWRVGLLLAAALALVVALVAVLPRLPGRSDPVAARTALAAGLAAFARGDITTAADRARAATRADPSWGLAHAVAARMLLELGDGAAAQAELDRARATGFDAARAAQLYAHAYLLQGDAAKALATAARTPPRYRGYADRIAARALVAQGNVRVAWARLSALAQATPGDAAVWTDLGRLHQGAGDLVAATLAVQRALTLAPNDGDALLLRGELVRAQYGLVGALPWFEAALRRDPRDHDALVEYAATLGEAGRYRDMLAASRRALAVRPGDPAAYYLQAVLAARAGQDDLARAMLDRTGGQLWAMPGALLLGGALDYADGAWRQAIGRWGTLVAQQPRNVTARRLLAAALLRSGDAPAAIEVLKPVASRDDADSYALGLVGRAFEQGGDRAFAARFLDRAQGAARGGAAAFGSDRSLAVLGAAVAASGAAAPTIEYVRALVAAGQGDAALAPAQRLVRANPGTPAAWLALGDVQAARGQWPAAVAAYRAAADRRFDEPTALRLVDAQDRAGDRAAAANTLALFASQNPGNVAAQRLIAQWQLADEDWDAAIDTLEPLRQRLGNRDAALLAALGYAYVGKGDAAGGEAYAAAAYRLAPLNPAAADAWGWALYNLGDYDRAGQLLEKAVTLAPALPGLRWHLAQTYWALGAKARAAQQAQAALSDRAFPDRAAAAAMAAGRGYPSTSAASSSHRNSAASFSARASAIARLSRSNLAGSRA